MSHRMEPLPIKEVGYGRNRHYVAVLELDADECEAIAYALSPGDLGAEELLVTAERMRAMAAEDDQ